ncbi:MAG: N-acetyltransferase [Chloroflexi bacterium]|nr:N-acetyltransferase [Chloroflexota bacterium]
MFTIRIAILSDLPGIVATYNQAIAARNATADTVPFTVEQRLDWFHAHTPEAYPIYVYEQDGQVLGWLSVSPYRGRPALVRTAEVSYYVDYAHHGRGIGSALMAHALEDVSRLGKKVYLAILLEWNTGSIRLLEKFGFEQWGYLPEVAEFDGRLCGQFYYGKKFS